jgi:hypothetical protein
MERRPSIPVQVTEVEHIRGSRGAAIIASVIGLNIAAAGLVALEFALPAPGLLSGGVSRVAAGFFLLEGCVLVLGLLFSPIIIPILIRIGIIGAGSACRHSVCRTKTLTLIQ